MWSIDSDTLQISLTENDEQDLSERYFIDKSTITTMSFINDPKKHYNKKSTFLRDSDSSTIWNRSSSTSGQQRHQTIPRSLQSEPQKYQQRRIPDYSIKR